MLVTDFIRQCSALFSSPRFPVVDPRRLMASLHALDSASDALEAQDTQAPIFLFATSWRSGSTLLQRLLCTDESALIWGEPLGRMALLPRLATALSAADRDWPAAESWFSGRNAGSLSSTWIANLYPPARGFRLALREFVQRWLGVTATEGGFLRWGMKEVRCGAAEAVLLRWLFPCAKFVVLVRNPFDAYRSLSRGTPTGEPWNMYSRWPEIPLTGAVSFARHWDALSASWSALDGDGSDYFLIKYEDLISGGVDYRKLESYLGLKLDESRALDTKIGGTHDALPLLAYERRLIRHEAGVTIKKFGY